MNFDRDVYKDFIKWKDSWSDYVLYVIGARQVGKTYLVKRFGEKEFREFHYINMMEKSGKDFLYCIENVPRFREQPLHEAFKAFFGDFQDSEDVLIAIDEIQESHEVYSLIRNFARDFKARFIVTGSYIGRLLDKDSKKVFFSVGDIREIEVTSMSFPEFLGSFGKRALFDMAGLFGESESAIYEELKGYYELYLKIGGYPKVIETYHETKDLLECELVMNDIIATFLRESSRYMDEPLDFAYFNEVFLAVAAVRFISRNSKDGLSEDLRRLITRTDKIRTNRETVNRALSWLRQSHVIGFASCLPDANPLEILSDSRIYFRDVGLANYYLEEAGIKESDRRGFIAENFVYLSMHEFLKKRKIVGFSPWYATYQGGELDFLAKTRGNDTMYGIEVKAGNSKAVTGGRMLSDGVIQYLYTLKDTCGGEENKKLTIPIYLADKMCFRLDNI